MRPIDSRQGCQNTFLMMTLKIVNNFTIDCGCAQSKLTSMACMPVHLCVKFLCVKLTNYMILIDTCMCQCAIRNQFSEVNRPFKRKVTSLTCLESECTLVATENCTSPSSLLLPSWSQVRWGAVNSVYTTIKLRK